MICVSPLVFEGGQRVVPCGKCYSCLSNRRNDWTFRLRVEAKESATSHFITLTIAPDYDVNYGNLNKPEVQMFMKRLRKSVEPIKIRYYLIGEYGTDTYRPHYHMLLFTDDYISSDDLTKKLLKNWQFGHIKVDPISEARIHYVTSYHITKSYTPDGLVPSFVLMSRNPGIGYQYLEKNRKKHAKRNQITYNIGGQRQKIPRYYSDKIYPKFERQLIGVENRKKAMDKLDKDIKRLMSLNNWSYGRAHYQLVYENYKQKEKITKIRKNKKL